ncbi:hypothetical protein JCM15765_12290 [Paradesulfitobacterium aromaticivorans]
MNIKILGSGCSYCAKLEQVPGMLWQNWVLRRRLKGNSTTAEELKQCYKRSYYLFLLD